MMNRKKLLPAHHTGKIRHHKHTSYGALAAALLITCVPLIAASRSVALAAADPVTADNTVYAVVPGPTPKTAPVITTPAQGAVFTNNNPITVSGNCPNDTLLKIYKNEVLGGSTLCQNGRFSIQVDLFIGPNTLIVRAYNASNNMGPESAPVVVTKELPGFAATAVTQQFFVTSDVYYKGVGTGQLLSWPLTLSGGQPPYAISIAWGDGKTDLISRGVLGTFEIQHTYDKPSNGYKGSYDVTIISTDFAGNKSFIHLVAVVTGDPTGIVGGIKSGYDWSSTIRIAWQLMLAALLILLAFWLGERRETKLLRKRAKLA
jgi:hypothetical protein